jgi:hypothetical protein
MLEILPAQPSEFEQVASLYRSQRFALPEEAHFTWKYFQNPDGDARIFRVLWHGELAGAVALLPRTFYFSGRRFLGLQAVDGLTGPQIRGKGFFVDVMRFVLDQHPVPPVADHFFYGFSVVPASVRALEKAGWERLTPFSVYAIPLSARALERLPVVGRAVSVTNLAWRVARNHIFRPHPGVDAQETSTFDEDLNGYFSPRRVHGDRSRQFINWRVFTNPQAQMRAFSIRENGRPVGFAIGKVDGATIEIIDLQLQRPDKRYVSALLSVLAEDSSLSMVNYWGLGPTRCRSLFPRLATLRRPCGGAMFVHRLRECGLPLAADEWEVSRLDSDW